MTSPPWAHPVARADLAKWRVAAHESGHALFASAVLGLRVDRVRVRKGKGIGGWCGQTFHEPTSNPAHALLITASGLAGERVLCPGPARGWEGDLRRVRSLASPASAIPDVSSPTRSRKPLPARSEGPTIFASWEVLEEWRSYFNGEAPEVILARASWLAEPFLRAREEALARMARWLVVGEKLSASDVRDFAEMLPPYLLANRAA